MFINLDESTTGMSTMNHHFEPIARVALLALANLLYAKIAYPIKQEFEDKMLLKIL